MAEQTPPNNNSNNSSSKDLEDSLNYILGLINSGLPAPVPEPELALAPVDSTIGGTPELPSFASIFAEQFTDNFRDRDFEIHENIPPEEFEGNVSYIQADLTNDATFKCGIHEELVPDFAGLKRCLCLIFTYMALSIGFWTYQVSLMLYEGFSIFILIVGTIFLLIPCVVYWLRCLNHILAKDEEYEDTDKSDSDVVPAANVQSIEMVHSGLANCPDNHVVEMSYLDESIPGNLGNNPQFLEEGRVPVRANKVSPPSSTSYEMPRISVAGDLLPPPLVYNKDEKLPGFTIGLPRYLVGTAVERDLKHSISLMIDP